MATKGAKMGAFGGAHTSGIFSDMTVDGPEIGTLVVIMDRAKNLPNRRSMGKQDPYCAARLGKEAKKTNTDKRGGQTPRWDQELRFTVHDSPDYHNLKVSVFNDDKKTELIGETWVSLENVLLPGGGQSDTWHSLNCKGKYAGEIRIELTYYDTRPKIERPTTEKKRETARAGGDIQAPSVGGPRENSPVKRRPLPSDPTGASPSPVTTPGDHRGVSGPHSGPRNYPTPPRQGHASSHSSEYTPTYQRRAHHPDTAHSGERRRPLPDGSPLTQVPQNSNYHAPQHQAYSSRSSEHNPYGALYNSSSTHLGQYNEDGFDMSYTAPKPYEVKPIDPLPSHPRDAGGRTMSQEEFHPSHGHMDFHHSHSAPVVPTHHSFDPEHSADRYSSQSGEYVVRSAHHPEDYQQPPNSYQQPMHHEHSQSTDFGVHNQIMLHDAHTGLNGYVQSQAPYDPFGPHGQPANSLQPTVEDEDDVPPPPPVHRSSASSAIQRHSPQPPSYHADTPAPLNISRFRDDPSRSGFDSPPQFHSQDEYGNSQPSERRYTHPQPSSRPVSRDAIVPSHLRQESSMPSALVAGFDSSRQDNLTSVLEHPRGTPPSYDPPGRLRQRSEPDYQNPPQYQTPPGQQPPVHQQIRQSIESPSYYPHPAPQEPQRRSPIHDPTPIVKPRAISPSQPPNQVDNRMSRMAARSTPTRKSVSPRPPPSAVNDSERRLSGVPFNPDSFDVLNPSLSKVSNGASDSKGDDRNSAQTEVNDKGQIVTFSGRVIDASDHLPVDSWAPEPERKGPQKDRPIRDRIRLTGARELEAAEQRERERKERDRIRHAVNASAGVGTSPNHSLVTSRPYSNGSPLATGSPMNSDHDNNLSGSSGRNRLQKRGSRPVSSFTPPSHNSPSHIPSPNTNVLRERENLGGYSGSPGYGAGARHSVAAPPIPAKIPLHSMDQEDMSALSRELQTIDIGTGSSGRNRYGGARRKYGGY